MKPQFTKRELCILDRALYEAVVVEETARQAWEDSHGKPLPWKATAMKRHEVQRARYDQLRVKIADLYMKRGER